VTEPMEGKRHITYTQQYRRRGKAACRCKSGGPGHGPYWYAYWREGGKLKCAYLGKELPGEVRTVRQDSCVPPGGLDATSDAGRR